MTVETMPEGTERAVAPSRAPAFRCAQLLLGAVTLVLVTGCYSYVPVDASRVSPPLRVRAQISPEASAAFTPILGSMKATLEGEYVERTPEGYFLIVNVGPGEVGFRSEQLTQKLLIPHDQLLGLQRQELNPTRTAMLAAGGAAVVGAIAYKAFSGTSGKSPDSGSPGPPEARIPIFRFSF